MDNYAADAALFSRATPRKASSLPASTATPRRAVATAAAGTRRSQKRSSAFTLVCEHKGHMSWAMMRTMPGSLHQVELHLRTALQVVG